MPFLLSSVASVRVRTGWQSLISYLVWGIDVYLYGYVMGEPALLWELERFLIINFVLLLIFLWKPWNFFSGFFDEISCIWKRFCNNV